MSKPYKVVAKVDQIVTKEVHLTVNANSPEEAEARAREALQVYPNKIDTDLGVTRLVTAKQTFWIPKSIDFTHTKVTDKDG